MWLEMGMEGVEIEVEGIHTYIHTYTPTKETMLRMLTVIDRHSPVSRMDSEKGRKEGRN